MIVAGLLAITALAWAYMLYLAAGMDMSGMQGMQGMSDMKDMDMSGMPGMAAVAGPQLQPWTPVDFALMFLMWAVMMVAMMLPSAAPMVLAFARVSRQAQRAREPYVPTAVFLLGYLAVWSAFSLLATALQWGLHTATLLSPMMVSTSPLLSGALLIAAGVFQWMPLKHACLRHCRSPLGFILNEWRDGAGGALLMGVRHGTFCLGCCWALMALLFVAGVMNLLWVAFIAAFVLVEKIVPRGHLVGQVAGVLLVGWGIWLIAAAV